MYGFFLGKMSGFQSIAVENTILSLLAASETNYDYPSLQADAVDIIATNLSDMVYTTLKQKSTASSTKRCNLLKFLNNICRTPEFHLSSNHHKIYLKEYEQEFCKANGSEVDDLLHIVSKELEEVVVGVHSEVTKFYQKKNARRKDRIKKQEFIRQIDQEKLSSTLGMHLSKNISHYETSQTLIDDLLAHDQNEGRTTNPILVRSNSRDYREKQVKFCYALTNIGADKSDMKILEHVIHKFSTYALLEQFEIKLLSDLWLMGERFQLDLSKIVTENFPFIIEKFVIGFCIDIVKLEDSSEVSKFFSDLSTNPKIVKLRDICTQNLGFYYKLKSLIFELYVLSYCNENVYIFSDYII